MRAAFVLPDPACAPDAWTRRSLELRNAATVSGRCSACGAGVRDQGVDHREIQHAAIRHAAGCRCSDERIAQHLRRRGLELRERFITIVAEVES